MTSPSANGNQQIHTKDADCDVDQKTLCCKVCGVDHSGKCEHCGGRGFHKLDCKAVSL